MEKSINVKAEEFKDSLYDLLNNSGLPICLVYYIFKNCEQDLEKTYYNIIKEENKENTGNPTSPVQ